MGAGGEGKYLAKTQLGLGGLDNMEEPAPCLVQEALHVITEFGGFLRKKSDEFHY